MKAFFLQEIKLNQIKVFIKFIKENLDLQKCQKDMKGESCYLHTCPRTKPRHKADVSGPWLSSVSHRFTELAPQTPNEEDNELIRDGSETSWT